MSLGNLNVHVCRECFAFQMTDVSKVIKNKVNSNTLISNTKIKLVQIE